MSSSTSSTQSSIPSSNSSSSTPQTSSSVSPSTAVPSTTTTRQSPPPSTSVSSPTSSSPETSSSSPSSTSESSPSSQSLTSTSSPSVPAAPVTTIVQTTVVTNSDGGELTTVSTVSTASVGSTGPASSDSTRTSRSPSHTGAIVGGVVGGTVALLLVILGAFWYIRRRRRLQDLAFDGNFDPNRIVRSPSGTGNFGGRTPTLPNIPVSNSDEQIRPEMSEMEDDGMGGRLNASTIGAGVLTPYPLYHSPSPIRSAPSPPPPSARSWGSSSDAQHSLTGHMQQQEWRGPSPGPSIPTQYTGGSATGVPPSSYPSIAHLPPGAAPGHVGVGVPASAYTFAGAQHRRRPSNGTSSSGEQQPLYSGGPSSTSSSGGTSVNSGGRFTVANPDENMNRYAGGYSEEARRAYIVGGPSSKSPTGPSQPHPREVLVHEDGGRVESNDGTPSEGPEEIPPTYDSILDAAGMTPQSNGKEHRSPR
ncbi:hypothetical protein D9757_002605 [Collybiopsis confluens]|uniref:Uncharacterized protein n=1 Tax=Collybiopsis confluens TaxID=2823264 RepID=A0A8H5ME51_9AGAR|nr:hypothetical protein D9757_002605 [Collybiopsis confluens]